jgi:branched-chain amino acid transport system substrate-binding protein
MKKLSPFFALALLVIAATACSDDDDGETVRIGALLPLTGALRSYGESSQATLEHARDTINEESDLKVELVIKDTATDREATLSAMEEYRDEGVKIIIGPFASSSVASAIDFANENGIIVISPLSTAGTLAIPNDNVFRFTPDETKEGEALAAVLVEDGITTVVPVNRDDDGNIGLVVGLTAAFEAAGGTMAEGVTYSDDEDDFPGVVEEIAAALEAAGGPAEGTAIYLAAFGEVTDLFNAASASGNEDLTAVPWYGSDSVAQDGRLVTDPVGAGFAVSVGYPNPILGLRDEDEDLWGPVVEDVQEKLGRVPDSFALAAYDALVVAHMAIEQAGVDADAAALGTALVEAASDHVGVTGPSSLNENGDRDHASFDFWSICEEGSGFTWKRTISYAVAEDGTGTISRDEC